MIIGNIWKLFIILLTVLNHCQAKSNFHNYIKNGDFETPKVGKFSFKQMIYGWKVTKIAHPLEQAQIKIGNGPFFNDLWGATQVVELDSLYNIELYQYISLEAHAEYVLQFSWAARKFQQHTSYSIVKWNYNIVEQIFPEDEQVYQSRIKVIGAETGQNKVSFLAQGLSDGYGLSIDNVQIYRIQDSPNNQYILNGKFIISHFKNKGRSMLIDRPGVLQGWIYNQAVQVGQIINYITYPNNYLFNFPNVVSLDSGKNINIGQAMILRQGEHQLEFLWAQPRNYSALTASAEIYWNDVMISLLPKSKDPLAIEKNVKKEKDVVHGLLGTNVLQFLGTGIPDGVGIIITNVHLERK